MCRSVLTAYPISVFLVPITVPHIFYRYRARTSAKSAVPCVWRRLSPICSRVTSRSSILDIAFSCRIASRDSYVDLGVYRTADGDRASLRVAPLPHPASAWRLLHDSAAMQREHWLHSAKTLMSYDPDSRRTSVETLSTTE